MFYALTPSAPSTYVTVLEGKKGKTELTLRGGGSLRQGGKGMREGRLNRTGAKDLHNRKRHLGLSWV